MLILWDELGVEKKDHLLEHGLGIGEQEIVAEYGGEQDAAAGFDAATCSDAGGNPEAGASGQRDGAACWVAADHDDTGSQAE
ncbi:hypothetical protein [Saccharopolyspora sp. NPDC049426]|uniref:hypothetical protein n=1 Tax=Saccharopolyspora sp. NPDC049426 TaxID=3155652 RepID=UPI00344400CF